MTLATQYAEIANSKTQRGDGQRPIQPHRHKSKVRVKDSPEPFFITGQFQNIVRVPVEASALGREARLEQHSTASSASFSQLNILLMRT